MFAKLVKRSRKAEEALRNAKGREREVGIPTPAKKKGHSLPKGKTRFDKGVRPSFMTRQQAVKLDKDIKNFNRRSKARFKKIQKGMPWLTYEQAYKDGLVHKPIEKGILDIRRRSDVEAIRYRIRVADTKANVADRLRSARNQVYEPIYHAVGLSAERKAWLKETVNGMSIEDIARWKRDIPFSDWMQIYGTHEADYLDMDQLNELEETLLNSLLPYAKRPIPAFVPRQL